MVKALAAFARRRRGSVSGRLARQVGYVQTVEFLITHGASVNALRPESMGPLHLMFGCQSSDYQGMNIFAQQVLKVWSPLPDRTRLRTYTNLRSRLAQASARGAALSSVRRRNRQPFGTAGTKAKVTQPDYPRSHCRAVAVRFGVRFTR